MVKSLKILCGVFLTLGTFSTAASANLSYNEWIQMEKQSQVAEFQSHVLCIMNFTPKIYRYTTGYKGYFT